MTTRMAATQQRPTASAAPLPLGILKQHRKEADGRKQNTHRPSEDQPLQLELIARRNDLSVAEVAYATTMGTEKSGHHKYDYVPAKAT